MRHNHGYIQMAQTSLGLIIRKAEGFYNYVLFMAVTIKYRYCVLISCFVFRPYEQSNKVAGSEHTD